MSPVHPKMRSENTYRFKITVNDIFVIQKSQTFDNWITKSPYEAQTEALIVVFLDQLIQVYAENRKMGKSSQNHWNVAVLKQKNNHKLFSNNNF